MEQEGIKMEKPESLCSRCEKSSVCLLNYDGVPCREIRTVEPTRMDYLRAMTVREFAEWLDYEFRKAEWCDTDKLVNRECEDKDACIECVAAWLIEEV